MYSTPSGYFPRTLPRGFGATNPLAVGSAAASSAASIAAAAAWIPAAAVPFIGPAIAGVSLAIEAIMNSGCGQTCIVSSQFANQAGDALAQNIAAYFALPTPRPYEAQQAALANFDQFWAWLIAPGQCGNPALGTAGKNCIADRQSGACKWKQTADKVPPWGTPPAGACWNYFNGFRDPIANDKNVAPPVTASSAASIPAALGINTSAWPAWWPIAVLGLLIAAVAL